MKFLLLILILLFMNVEASDITVSIRHSTADNYPAVMCKVNNDTTMLQIFYSKRSGESGIIHCISLIPNRFKQIRLFAPWFRGNRFMISGVDNYVITVVERDK